VKFRPTFCNFFPGPYWVEKIHRSTFICFLHPGKEARPQTNHRKKIRGRKARTFCFRKTDFVHSRSRTYCALLLGYFGLNFYQTFVIVSIEFWLRFEPQNRPTRFSINFLFITARAERKVRLCVKLFDFFPGWILIRLTWNLLRLIPNLVEILTQNIRKKPFRENFAEILCKQRLSSRETCLILPYFLQFFSGSVLRWKKFTQVLSYVVCT